MLCDQYYLTSPEVEIKQVNCERECFSPKCSVFVCPVHGESWTVRKPELCSGALYRLIYTYLLIYSLIDSMLACSCLTVWDGANKMCWVGIIGMLWTCPDSLVCYYAFSLHILSAKHDLKFNFAPKNSLPLICFVFVQQGCIKSDQKWQ